MDSQKEFLNKEIEILQYASCKSSYSFGKINSKKENFEFAHSASTLKGSSGSPIFLKHTSKVIGIHKSGGTTQNYGDFIGPIFNYFRNYSKNNNKHNNKHNTNDNNKEIYMKNIIDNKKNKNIDININININNKQKKIIKIIFLIIIN